MKTVSSIIGGLKFIVKYGALLAVIVKIVQFAINEFENLNLGGDAPKVTKEAESE